MIQYLRLAATYLRLTTITLFLLVTGMVSYAQTTYDFSTNATLSSGDNGFGIWNTQANITVDGVNYKLTSGGNGSFTNQATGGVSNSKVLRKEGSGGDVFTIQRSDGQAFKFYGFWVKHQSMNNYAQFYSLPPFYTITYNKSDGTTETYNDNTAMTGSTAAGQYTSSSTTFTKDLTVTSVTINFKAIIYYWIDDIKVGPAAVATPPSFSVHPSNKTICAGSNTTFSVTASDATSYQWQVNTGSGFTNVLNNSPYSNATTATISISGATAGMNGYTYRCVATGSGSTTSSSATLTVTSISTSGSQINLSCFGGSNGSATVTASGGTGSYAYSWSPSGGTGATATGLSAGTYTVTVTDANGCTATRNFTITQPSALTASTSQTNVSCNGGSNGAASVSVSGGAGSYAYFWSPSGGTGATASGLSAGTYTVTITDANNCQINKSFTITEPIKLVATADPSSTSVCSGNATSISLNSTTAGASFSWTVSTVSGTVSGASASSGSSIAQTLTGDGEVKYTITPSNGGCTGSSISVNVIVKPLTTISSTLSNINIDEEQDATFTIMANNATSYQWQVNKGSGFTNITNTAPHSGATTTTLTITSATGEMNGYVYRCIASGNCLPVAMSNSATLSVRVKTPQTIKFSPPQQVTYGAADFAPDASSDAGLNLAFTSSDETIASIVNDKVHIKKAGEVTITASQAGNNDYKPASPVSQTLTIAKKDITLSLNATPLITKTYDGGTGASLAQANYNLQGIIDGNDVAVSGTAKFENDNAGTGKTINVSDLVLSGDDKANYTLVTSNATVSGDITKKEIAVSLNNAPQISKVYDATTDVVLVDQNYTLNGTISSDMVSVTGKAVYADKNAGTNKTVTVTDFVLAGDDKGNYDLTTISAETTGSISAKEIFVKFSGNPAIKKVYDGGTIAYPAKENYQLLDVEEGDDVSVSGIAAYNDKNAGTGKAVTVEDMKLSGADWKNYELANTSAVTTGVIVLKTLTLTLQPEQPSTKLYELTRKPALNSDTYVLNGVVDGDDVRLKKPAISNVANKTSKIIVLAGPAIEGADAGNYVLNMNNAIPAPARIATGEMTVTSKLGSNASAIAGERYSMKAWISGPGTLQVNIYSTVSQKAAIILYTDAGQQVMMEQKQLNAGVNNFTLSVAQLGRGTYAVGVRTERFRDTQKVRLK